MNEKQRLAIQIARSCMNNAFNAENLRYRSIVLSMGETCFDYALGELRDDGELFALYQNLDLLTDVFEDTFAQTFGQEIGRFGVQVTQITDALKDNL